MLNIILINSRSGEDYLADLYMTSILRWKKARVFTNYIPNYLFEDYKTPDSLYGRGFTAFCTLPSRLRSDKRIQTVDLGNIVSLASDNSNLDFQVVYTSIWRESRELSSITGVHRPLNISKIHILDGEDEENIHEAVDLDVAYWKRELTISKQNLKPISFCLPPNRLPFITNGYDYIPKKTILLAPCDPRLRETYVFNTQDSYYLQYQSSLFAATTKKGGWDCLRHYEVLANHCIPYFPGIQRKHHLTMASYPVSLQIEANRLCEGFLGCESRPSIGMQERYKEILRQFMAYFYSSCMDVSYRRMLLENN